MAFVVPPFKRSTTTTKTYNGYGSSNENSNLTNFRKNVLDQLKEEIEEAEIEADRSERFLKENPGLIQVEGMEKTTKIRQEDIINQCPISVAKKRFDLKLDQFGPYQLSFTQNGRYLLLAGEKGHLASIDWLTKRLNFEIHTRDLIRDICWLHNQTMFASAQKNYVYIYDNKGTELHRVDTLAGTTMMSFLPRHFLLSCLKKNSRLAYFDTSIGSMVSEKQVGFGTPKAMCQNPWNAVIQVAHNNGCVTFWSPSCKRYLQKILCHPAPIASIAVNNSGTLLATSDIGNHLKIWDLRTHGNLRSYRLGKVGQNLTFSQRDLLAFTVGNIVEVWKDVGDSNCDNWRYLRFDVTSTQSKPNHPLGHDHVYCNSDLKFCPFEDTLVVAKTLGISSIIVPGAGEPNIDSLRNNPFESTQERRETEVRSLLDKIPAELISLDPSDITSVIQAPPRDMKKINEDKMLKKLMPKKVKSKKKFMATKKQVNTTIMKERKRQKLIESIEKSEIPRKKTQKKNESKTIIQRNLGISKKAHSGIISRF